VPDVDEALAQLLAGGAGPEEEVEEVGDGIRVASVREPGGGILGIIENPHFELKPVASAGPGK
jgi:hypothetical protein